MFFPNFINCSVNTAIYELTNEEIMADIISLIRRYAIGSTLISHDAQYFPDYFETPYLFY